MTTTELKPCPFCGFPVKGPSPWKFRCDNCGMVTEFYGKSSIEDRIECWNRRVKE